jgi:hypothetical protein
MMQWRCQSVMGLTSASLLLLTPSSASTAAGHPLEERTFSEFTDPDVIAQSHVAFLGEVQAVSVVHSRLGDLTSDLLGFSEQAVEGLRGTQELLGFQIVHYRALEWFKSRIDGLQESAIAVGYREPMERADKWFDAGRDGWPPRLSGRFKVGRSLLVFARRGSDDGAHVQEPEYVNLDTIEASLENLEAVRAAKASPGMRNYPVP